MCQINEDINDYLYYKMLCNKLQITFYFIGTSVLNLGAGFLCIFTVAFDKLG